MSRSKAATRYAVAAMAALLVMAGARADGAADRRGSAMPIRACPKVMGRMPGWCGSRAAASPWATTTSGPEERAAHEVTVAGFWIDRHEVTNAQFTRFVAATGYVTVAERGLDPKEHAGMPPELLAPGAVVFTPPDGLLNLVDVSQWWRYVAGADWRHPLGPRQLDRGARTIIRSSMSPTRTRRPTRAGAAASCRARRSGNSPRAAGWTARPTAGATSITIRWRAGAPTAGRGFFRSRTTPTTATTARRRSAASRPTATACSTWRATSGSTHATGTCRRIRPRRRPIRRGRAWRWPRATPGRLRPSVVIKGGSYLCAPNFCARYRPSARQPQELGLGASHLGFRTVLNGPGEKAARRTDVERPADRRPADGSLATPSTRQQKGHAIVHASFQITR